jgi:hypothetical protein
MNSNILSALLGMDLDKTIDVDINRFPAGTSPMKG